MDVSTSEEAFLVASTFELKEESIALNKLYKLADTFAFLSKLNLELKTGSLTTLVAATGFTPYFFTIPFNSFAASTPPAPASEYISKTLFKSFLDLFTSSLAI